MRTSSFGFQRSCSFETLVEAGRSVSFVIQVMKKNIYVYTLMRHILFLVMSHTIIVCDKAKKM